MDLVKLFKEKQNSLQNINGIDYFYIHEEKSETYIYARMISINLMWLIFFQYVCLLANNNSVHANRFQI